MSNDLAGQVVIVTGGGGGIGSRIAHAFAKEGAKVVIASRSMDKLKIVADEITATGQTCLPIECDVTDPDQVESMIEQTVQTLGGLDVLVNNAGGAMFVKPPEKLRPEQWRAAMALNLDSVFFCSIAAGKHMIAQNCGCITGLTRRRRTP